MLRVPDVLFRDLRLRPGLRLEIAVLVTVSALIALGHVTQIPYHLNRAMDNSLTQAEASEVLTHLAFYAGWAACDVRRACGEGRLRQEAALNRGVRMNRGQRR